MNKKQQIDFLIEKLSPGVSVPPSIDDAWNLYRALVNVREPLPVESDYIQVQDKLLHSLTLEKGITKIADLQPVRNNLYLWQGDITTLKVDAIVNAANSGMLGCFVPCHNCIDNVIHTYAGVQLRLECDDIMRKQGYPEPAGRAKITKAYNLPSKYILHTVGPMITGDVRGKDRKLLADCYCSCLKLAKQYDINNVAFCCISTGEFCFPNQEAAEIAVSVVTEHQVHNPDVGVIFNVFKDIDYEIYRKLLGGNKTGTSVN